MAKMLAAYLFVGMVLSGIVMSKMNRYCTPQWPRIDTGDIAEATLFWPVALVAAIFDGTTHNDPKIECHP